MRANANRAFVGIVPNEHFLPVVFRFQRILVTPNRIEQFRAFRASEMPFVLLAFVVKISDFLSDIGGGCRVNQLAVPLAACALLECRQRARLVCLSVRLIRQHCGRLLRVLIVLSRPFNRHKFATVEPKIIRHRVFVAREQPLGVCNVGHELFPARLAEFCGVVIGLRDEKDVPNVLHDSLCEDALQRNRAHTG